MEHRTEQALFPTAYLLPMPAVAAARQRQVDGAGDFGLVDVVVMALVQPLDGSLLARGATVCLRAGGGQAGEQASDELETHVSVLFCSSANE
jgi:hypothetical protein